LGSADLIPDDLMCNNSPIAAHTLEQDNKQTLKKEKRTKNM